MEKSAVLWNNERDGFRRAGFVLPQGRGRPRFGYQTMMLVLGASVLCQLGAAALCVRMFWMHGRRWVWTGACVLALFSVFYTALQFHHFAPGAPIPEAMRATVFCTLALSVLLVACLAGQVRVMRLKS